MTNVPKTIGIMAAGGLTEHDHSSAAQGGVLNPEAALSPYPFVNYGDGSDGDVTITGPVTLTRDMQYKTLTVTATGILYPAGFRIQVRDALTIAAGGVISADGGAGTDGQFGAPGHPGLGGSPPYLDSAELGVSTSGGLGGAGVGAGTNNGAGGVPPDPVILSLLSPVIAVMRAGEGGGGGGNHGSIATAGANPIACLGGAKGGVGGAGVGSNSSEIGGGGGGAGGGVILIMARIINNAGTISASGGAGGKGAVDTGDAATMSGNGGGGGGGSVVLLYDSGTGSGTGSVLTLGGIAPTSPGNGGANGSPGPTYFFGPFTDPLVPALLHFDGVNYGRNIIDETGRVWTPQGSGFYFQTADKKFGVSSALFSNAYIDTPDVPALQFGGGDFTIDFWLKCPSPGDFNLISQCLDSTTFGGMKLLYRVGSGGWYVALSSNNISWDISSGAPALSAGNYAFTDWTHIAFVRFGNIYTIYIGGVAGATPRTLPGILSVTGQTFKIGGESDAESFYGGLDELRISKGIARWTSNFTPPLVPYHN